MGNDGGSIPKRRELVKEAAKAQTTTQLKESLLDRQDYYWTTDPLTNHPLRVPIVSDCTGRLYNKDSILEFLLPADEHDDEAKHKKVEAEKVLAGSVKSLRDVVEVKFEEDPEAKTDSGKWLCPITNKSLGPGSKAVYLVPCGHAYSGPAVREVAGGKCLQCNEAYTPENVIPIVPITKIDIARLAQRIIALKEKGLTHSLKKAPGSKKRKKNGDANGTLIDNKVADLVSSTSSTRNGATGIKNSSTASLTAKVLEEQEERNKRRKMAKNETISSLFSSRDQTKPIGKSSDFMTRGYSIPAQEKR